MGKMLFLVIAALTFSVSTVLHSTRMGSSESDQRFNERAAEVLAQRVALSGLHESTQVIFDSYEASGSYTGPLTLSGAYDGGSYAVDISTSSTSISLKVVGLFGGARHTLSRSYTYIAGGGGTAPPFMGQPITCGGNFNVYDDFNLTNPSEDTNVHANGNFNFEEDANALITGYGYYGENVNLDNGQTLSEIFQPTSGGTPVTEQVATIDVPYFNPSAYEGIATVTTYDNVTLSGTVALGTKENPKIWYIEGNLTTTGPVTFTGYGVFIVGGGGNVKLYHSVQTAGSAQESTVGFYASGNILIENAGLTMAGQWFVNGNVKVRANTTFEGTITNSGNCKFEESFNMGYRPASAALTEPFWPSEGEEGPATPGALQLAGARAW